MSRGRDGGAPGAPGRAGTTHLRQGAVPPVPVVSLVALQLLLVLIRHQRDGDNAGREVQDVVQHGVADCHWEKGGACSASLHRESLHTSVGGIPANGALALGNGALALAEGWKSALGSHYTRGLFQVHPVTGLQLSQEPSHSCCWPAPQG